MSHIPETIFFIKEHECVSVQDDGSALVGTTEYVQENLYDITFVEFSTVGESFSQIDTFGLNESVNAASAVFMPLDAKAIELNEDVEAEPRLLNIDPYDKGWLLKIRISYATQVDGLLRAEGYSQLV